VIHDLIHVCRLLGIFRLKRDVASLSPSGPGLSCLGTPKRNSFGYHSEGRVRNGPAFLFIANKRQGVSIGELPLQVGKTQQRKRFTTKLNGYQLKIQCFAPGFLPRSGLLLQKIIIETYMKEGLHHQGFHPAKCRFRGIMRSIH